MEESGPGVIATCAVNQRVEAENNRMIRVGISRDMVKCMPSNGPSRADQTIGEEREYCFHYACW